MFKNKEIKAGMYLRLSKDDGINMESNSISNQRDYIQSYADCNSINIVKEYVDDGYSGTDFVRPGFQEMIRDIENKIINCVIIKDLSRFSREYIGAGNYIQKIFPENNIRFISINDNYDSSSANNSDRNLILPIKNFINESYARDISMKVRTAQNIKRKNGKFIAAFCPYGYMKDDEDKNQLVVDRNVRNIIKSIFDMKLKGYSSKAIADELNALGIDSPKIYKEKQGLNYTCGFETTNGGKWSANAINRIIKNRVYIGYLEQGKKRRINFKNKKQFHVDKKDWIVVENTHEPIIRREVFEIANNMLLRDLNSSSKSSLFSGLLFCDDCGRAMARRTVKTGEKTNIYYICSKYNRGGNCTRHSIKEEALIEMVNTIFQDYILFNQRLLSKVKKVNLQKGFKDNQIDILKKEKEMTETLVSSLYTDLHDNVITDEEFKIYRKNYLARINELESNIANRYERQKELREMIDRNQSWVIDLMKYKKMTHIDRLSLVMLVDKILVSENKEVKVIFNHKEQLEFVEEILKANKSQTGSVCHG